MTVNAFMDNGRFSAVNHSITSANLNITINNLHEKPEEEKRATMFSLTC